MPNYDTAPQDILDLIEAIKTEYHPKLVAADVTIDAVVAFDDKGGFPVKFGGYPALAVVKITNLKNRVKGFADAELTIDGEAYKALTEPQKRALLDHELHHLVVKKDKEGLVKTDDASRPKLGMKKHDYQLGWFKEIAVRHGENSPEVYQASILWNRDGKAFFPTVA